MTEQFLPQLVFVNFCFKTVRSQSRDERLTFFIWYLMCWYTQTHFILITLYAQMYFHLDDENVQTLLSWTVLSWRPNSTCRHKIIFEMYTFEGQNTKKYKCWVDIIVCLLISRNINFIADVNILFQSLYWSLTTDGKLILLWNFSKSFWKSSDIWFLYSRSV